LHRLRRILPQPDLIVQRDGRLKLASERIWIDLEDWEQQPVGTGVAALDRLREFRGPLVQPDRLSPRAGDVADRVRGEYLAQVKRCVDSLVQEHSFERALQILYVALGHYPATAAFSESIAKTRLLQNDQPRTV
jgi:hypothetical protein